MPPRRFRPAVVAASCALATLFCALVAAQQPPPSSAARILLLPRRVVSGERATLAVLDVNGRLTPGVSVDFSNRDRLTTDATGRALFVAPLNPGVISASIVGRPGKVYMTVLSTGEAAAPAMKISTAPRLASLSDRFEVSGAGFCGDADANQVVIAGQPALVLAASPASLVILPPAELDPGPASVTVDCAKRAAPPFSVTFVSLALQADSSPLAPGEHRTLTVHVRGTAGKVPLEATNLAPDVADLASTDPIPAHSSTTIPAAGPAIRNGAAPAGSLRASAPVRTSSTGGLENVAHFEVIGRQRGNFLISIRLAPTQAPPTHGNN